MYFQEKTSSYIRVNTVVNIWELVLKLKCDFIYLDFFF